LYVATDIGTFILNFDNNHNPYFQKIKGIDSQSFSLCEMDSPNGKFYSLEPFRESMRFHKEELKLSRLMKISNQTKTMYISMSLP
jgi:hypothetical protein